MLSQKKKQLRFNPIKNDERPFIWFLHDAFRILRDGGSLSCFCRWDVQQEFIQAIDCAGFNIKSQVIWDREIHGMGDLKAQFAPQHDVILFAIKGKFEFKNGRPHSVIRIPRVSGEKLVHPNEKPIELMKYFIKYLTDEGMTIIDPFCGSGSTLIACKELQRNFIGIELTPEYVEIANKRLEHHTTQSQEKI